MATFTLFDEFKKYQGDGTIDLDTHVFKVYLSNATPTVATHSVKADLANITEQNGYAQATLTCTWTETSAGSGIWRFAANADVTWTASGGNFGPFRYVIIFDDSTTSPVDALVGYWDVGSEITKLTGEPFTVDLNATFDIFTLDG